MESDVTWLVSVHYFFMFLSIVTGILICILSYIDTAVNKDYYNAVGDGMKNCYRNMWVSTKIILGKLIKTMFDNVFVGLGL